MHIILMKQMNLLYREPMMVNIVHERRLDTICYLDCECKYLRLNVLFDILDDNTYMICDFKHFFDTYAIYMLFE